MHTNTTYKHDFVPPNSLLPKPNINLPPKTELSGKVPKCTPISANEKCKSQHIDEKKTEKIADACKKHTEWTGIAPMGILITPRILPENNINETPKIINSCYDDQPNKFLQQLPIKYPTLYEQLKNTNPDDIQRQANISCLKSTYQIDYGHVPEYAKGFYPKQTLTGKKIEFSNENVSGFTDPCAIEDLPRRKKWASACTLKHCPIKRKRSCSPRGNRRISEYMDRTSRIGGMIMKEKLNDHKQCKNDCIHTYRLN